MLALNIERRGEGPRARAARARCRSCGAAGLIAVLDLGMQPLANRLVDESDAGCDELRFPLDLACCPRCSLLQITESVSPALLFGDFRTSPR